MKCMQMTFLPQLMSTKILVKQSVMVCIFLNFTQQLIFLLIYSSIKFNDTRAVSEKNIFTTPVPCFKYLPHHEFWKKNIIGMNNAFFLLVVKWTERHMVVYQEWRMYHCTYIFLTADVPANLIKLLLINILLLC